MNLGDHTPDKQKNQLADHALVFMFQPFRGMWVQAVACFLSKGCAPGKVLNHLVLECIKLLEQAGFFVDGFTTDGAQWNRGAQSQNINSSVPNKSVFRSRFAERLDSIFHAIQEDAFHAIQEDVV